MAKKNRPGSVKGIAANYFIEHSHSSKAGLRSVVRFEDFQRGLRGGNLELIAPKIARVKIGLIALIDSEKELQFVPAHGKVLLNWDLIRRAAKFFKPSTEKTIDALMREGRERTEPVAVYESFERQENGQTTVRKRLLYYTQPIV